MGPSVSHFEGRLDRNNRDCSVCVLLDLPMEVPSTLPWEKLDFSGSNLCISVQLKQLVRAGDPPFLLSEPLAGLALHSGHLVSFTSA